MINYARILFPVDLSPTAPFVAKHVAAMAGKFAAELHVLHVIPSYNAPPYGEAADTDNYVRLREEYSRLAMENLEQFCAEHLGDAKSLQAAVESGHTGRVILRYIEQHPIDLVIMGTHGRSGLNRVFFGSVAQRVVQSSSAPVLTINPATADKRCFSW